VLLFTFSDTQPDRIDLLVGQEAVTSAHPHRISVLRPPPDSTDHRGQTT
jgi:hypothetical protein